MPVLLAILAAACFGIGGVFVRKGVHASNTYTGAIVNITVNSLVLLPFGIQDFLTPIIYYLIKFVNSRF